MTDTEAATRIAQVGPVMVPVSDQDQTMFFFGDQDGNGFMIVQPG